ncbi:hypothetical protein ARMGADRAFT_1039657 [Armillaria gallica]|uniref:Uncharacterized protein n=1 Tax=Armillaria gallica TaxID=47427 RepID=A0A2H3CXZ3_ARMGA|nr:hypothetical protein ARMGADRAFT_1039657 [Armillaria gallica]
MGLECEAVNLPSSSDNQLAMVGGNDIAVLATVWRTYLSECARKDRGMDEVDVLLVFVQATATLQRAMVLSSLVPFSTYLLSDFRPALSTSLVNPPASHYGSVHCPDKTVEPTIHRRAKQVPCAPVLSLDVTIAPHEADTDSHLFLLLPPVALQDGEYQLVLGNATRFESDRFWVVDLTLPNGRSDLLEGMALYDKECAVGAETTPRVIKELRVDVDVVYSRAMYTIRSGICSSLRNGPPWWKSVQTAIVMTSTVPKPNRRQRRCSARQGKNFSVLVLSPWADEKEQARSS